MITMYGALPNSPEITLAAAITADDTSIIVSDASKYAALDTPYPMTIGKSEEAETVLVTAVDGNMLTVQRGFEGTARAWSAGTSLSRNFTAYDYNAIISNVSAAASSINGIPVDTSSLADGQLLAYNASQNKIVPLTLKLSAGQNITITEDNGIYTISSTGGGGDDMGVGTWINELAMYGEQSYVGKDIDKILQLISDGQIYKHDLAKTELLDTSIANGLHMGTIFKAMLGSSDTMWDSLAAIDSVAASETAVNALIANDVVWGVVVVNELAMTAIAASSTAMTAIAASSTAMTAIIANSTAMTAIIANSTAMTAIAASSTAMTAIAASSTAMTAIAASSTAMTAIAASSTAMSTMWANITQAGQNAIRSSAVAMTALRNSPRIQNVSTNNISETTIYSNKAFVVSYKYGINNSSNYMYVGRDKFTNSMYNNYISTSEVNVGFFANRIIAYNNYSTSYSVVVYYIPC
jgi:outer membrane lipoprotein-sorting protein